MLTIASELLLSSVCSLLRVSFVFSMSVEFWEINSLSSPWRSSLKPIRLLEELILFCLPIRFSRPLAMSESKEDRAFLAATILSSFSLIDSCLFEVSLDRELIEVLS